jgi:glycerate kinase
VSAGPGDRTLTVLFAPDSFKGSLSSVAVAAALAEGWARARPGDRVLLAPLADGGEGTLAAIEAAGGWEGRSAPVHDPLGRPVDARWLASADGTHAVIELAAASGLSLVAPPVRDPVGASTAGTGELLVRAIDAGIHEIVLGIGGSATTDGGAGALAALGARVSEGLDAVDLRRLDPRLAAVGLRIACDVTNPLLGARGAAATYGPQKGASPYDVATLDARLGRWADALEAASGRRERETSGAGAAGGIGFGLLCLTDRFRSLSLEPGVDLVMAATGFDAKLATANIVVTGEGRIDAQTAFGKTALGVARRAQAAGVRCIAVGGGVEPEGVAALAALGVEVVPVHERAIPVAEAIALGVAPLVALGERLARRIDHAKPRRMPPGDRIIIHPNFDDPLPEFDPDYMHPDDPLREPFQ